MEKMPSKLRIENIEGTMYGEWLEAKIFREKIQVTTLKFMVELWSFQI